ncbi:MAG TPA: glycosyltransferase, partial [Methylocystis sp.]|nr:glycosyltransferase [Methylocystis sp.]
MFERILHGCQSLRSIFAAACRLIPKSVSPAHGLSDGEFVMNLAEAFYPMQGARAADIEIGKNYLRESPHRRWVFADAGMRAYSERMQAPQLDDHPLHFYMPGVDAVVTPEKWRERARQVAERSSESSRTGASSNIKPDFKHSGDYVVSVITSLYKGGRFIQRFLENMTEQTIFDRSELIIVDADSPEGEREMIERYMKAFDNIVYKR